MDWSGRLVAPAGLLSAVSLLAGFLLFTAAHARAADPEGTPEPLGQVLDTRSQGNDEASGVQKRIDGISDETDDLLAQYRTVLKQIDSIDLYNTQMGDLITAQEEELASLKEQLGRVQGVGRSVTPLMLRMVSALEKFVRLDVPFLADERAERITSLTQMMGRADVTTAEKFRQIMEAYQIENEYGRTIEAYRASLLLGDRETTVDFLRFGRIALVYQSLDETESGRWDQDQGAWVSLDGSHRSSIRDGLRIARKQSAPDLIRLPLAAPVDKRGAQ
jgi:hypothetical protein